MRSVRYAVLFSAVAGMAACTVGPDYVPPTPLAGSTGPIVTAIPLATTVAYPPDAWWRLYDDSSLNGFISEAFAANQDLKTAEANLLASRSIYEGARSGLYPQTEIGSGGTYGRDPTADEILELNRHKPFTDWHFDALIDLSYELDLFGGVRRSIETAKDNNEAVAAARDVLRITIAAETVRAYAGICTFGEQVLVAEHSLALVSREEEITRGRRAAGAGADFDVVRAEELTAQVRASIPPLEGQRRAAVFQLAALLGRSPSEAPTVDCNTAPHLTAPIPVGDGAALLKRRPDIRRADRELATALAEVGVATADLYPRVTLGGSYGGFSDKIDLLATGNALGWGVGPKISWTFPNMTGPLARVREAKANAQGALSNFNSVVLTALKETEQALAVYSSELDHHAALAVAQEKARRAFDLAQDEFKAGAISDLDLLVSESTLVAADAAVAASDTTIVQDQIAVFKALGGGWQPGTNTVPLAESH